MGLFNNWPYTNFHELNLDWIINKIKELFTELTKTNKKVDDNYNKLLKLFNDEVEQEVIDYVNEHLSQFILNVTYIKNRNAIKLQVHEEVTP